MPKKPPPAVMLESVFVRDHQRRLRLALTLLEEEARRQLMLPETRLSPKMTESPSIRAAAAHSPGGTR
jgi:hypothetical protein